MYLYVYIYMYMCMYRISFQHKTTDVRRPLPLSHRCRSPGSTLNRSTNIGADGAPRRRNCESGDLSKDLLLSEHQLRFLIRPFSTHLLASLEPPPLPAFSLELRVPILH